MTPRLLARQDVEVAFDPRGQDVRAVQELEPLRRGAGREDPVQDLLDLVTVKVPGHVVALRIVPQMLDTEELAEGRPALVVASGKAEPAVLGAERAPDAMEKLVAAAGARRLPAGERRVGELEGLHGNHRPIDARADLLALPCAFARVKRREDAGGEGQGGVRVGDRGAGR